MQSINFWPILVASIVAFGIGALWYSPILFGKEWMALTRTSGKDVADTKMGGMFKYYVIQFIFTIVMFIVTGFAVASSGTGSASDGGFIGFLAWLGFIVPVMVSNLLWKREPFKLALIEAINYLVTLVVGGAIIGAWR